MKIKVPGCMALTVHDRRWFVLRVKTGLDFSYKAGSMDVAFDRLKDVGYDVYLPRRRFDRFNRRVRTLVEWSEPLLPGYMFIAHPRKGMPIDDWEEVRAIKGVFSPLGDREKPLLIPPSVIEMLVTAEFESVYDETVPAKRLRGESERQKLEKRFAPGSRFVIQDGPFASLLAEVDSMGLDDKVKTLVDIFGRLVPVEFAPDQLEEAPERARPNVA